MKLFMTCVFLGASIYLCLGKSTQSDVPPGLIIYKIPNVTEEMRADLISQALTAQNCYRAKHGADPLVLDPVITQVSQNWANRLAALGSLQHSGNSNYGENLFAAGQSLDYGGIPFYYWYKEFLDCGFIFGTNNPQTTVPGCATGHFTQVVWKATKSCGFGIAVSPTWTYFVANYFPPGNYGEQYAANVGPPSDNDVNSCQSSAFEPGSIDISNVQIL